MAFPGPTRFEKLLMMDAAIGRTTVALLQMNHPDYLALRESLIEEGFFPAKR